MTNQPGPFSVGEPSRWQGDVDDLAPDLRDFFPNRPQALPKPDPLPYVDERELRLAPGHLEEVFPPSVDLVALKRRALAMTRQRWSVTMIAARLNVSTRTVFRWRLADRLDSSGAAGGDS